MDREKMGKWTRKEGMGGEEGERIEGMGGLRGEGRGGWEHWEVCM